ncbi:response regulator [uncultured Boseongicola sp.]|jgi:CheY-like chemotaxis protein|uniref:response regulator n=1 Tax=uncultured Boseongicola sp. TaxID=1648499 RepID=UPI0026124FBB|nr:response regulator [uncultured Boseongicola sp.]
MNYIWIALCLEVTPSLSLKRYCTLETLLGKPWAGADRKAGSGNPDLISLDMSLPVVDGWHAARALKSNAATKDIPIIALTAHAMAGDKGKALEAGCVDYDYDKSQWS